MSCNSTSCTKAKKCIFIGEPGLLRAPVYSEGQEKEKVVCIV